MIYRVVLVANGEYKKTLHRCRTSDTAFLNFHRLKDENKAVMFPKNFVNSNAIVPIKYQICVTKPTEPTDTFRMLRDKFGRTYQEKPLGDWTILHSDDYELEETFWIYGMDKKEPRPNLRGVMKKLMVGAYKSKITKQVIVVYNKLVIYNEEQFDMVICKCLADAQRLHHTLSKVARKQGVKSLIFMGTATKASVGRLYDIIKEQTNWPIEKIYRRSTRP